MSDGQNEQFERIAHSLETLSRRLDELGARLDTIEEGIAEPPGAGPVLVPGPAGWAAPQAPADKDIPRDRSGARAAGFVAEQERVDPSVTPPAQRWTPSHPTASKPRKPSLDLRGFEWLIGAKGLALAGMLIVVVGVGMFLKLAYDNGWIAAISPVMRCLASAVFGGLLVGAGELLRRRINPLASSGATAAGLAVIYASILAAANLYGLIGLPLAFAMLAVVTVSGVLLGSLSNRVMLSLFSLVGAFIAPLLLETREASYVVMPAYLLALLSLGLTLSAWRGGGYAHVRRLAWWGTGILGTLWLSKTYAQAPVNAIVFVSLVWLATVAELLLSSRFMRRLRGRDDWPESSRAGFIALENGEKTFDPRALLEPEARWINALFGVTIWAVAGATLAIREISLPLDFLAPLGFACSSLLVALVAVGGRGENAVGICPSRSSARSAFSAALVVNASLLGIAAIAIGLGGWAQVVAWLCVGLAAVETGCRVRFRAVSVFGLLLLGVAIARLLTIDFIAHMGSVPGRTIWGLAFTDWSPQMAMASLVCAAAAWRLRFSAERSIAACASMWILAIAFVHLEDDADALGAAMLLVAVFAAWISITPPITRVRASALVLAFLGTVLAVSGQLTLDLQWRLVSRINPISMGIAACGWIAISALPRSRYAMRVVGASLAALCALIGVGRLFDETGFFQALFAETSLAALIVLLGTRLWRWSLIEIASVVLWIIAIVWMFTQFPLDGASVQGPPIAHWGFAPAITLVVATLGAGLLLGSRPIPEDGPGDPRSARRSFILLDLAAAWLVLMACSSIEIERAMRTFFPDSPGRGAAVSIWWSLYAIGSIALGFRLAAKLRLAGLSLLGIVAIKVLFIDTVTLAPAARVVAAITVGLVIIAAGVLYARLVSAVDAAQENEPGGPISG